MATTKSNKVGKIRIKLALLLEDAIPTVQFEPWDLRSQIPVYASALWDCCSWSGDGKDDKTGLTVHVASWDTMTECVRDGIAVTQNGPFSWDIHSGE